jgi:hypothetical protein
MAFVFPASYRGPNTEHSKILWNYFVILPIYPTAKAVEGMYKYCGMVFGCDLNPHPHCL